MLEVVRYINGKQVEKEDLPKYEIDSEIILRTIKAVNERVQKNANNKFISDGVAEEKESVIEKIRETERTLKEQKKETQKKFHQKTFVHNI
jgi:hypothetical protein